MAWWLRKHSPKGAEPQRIGYSAGEPATAHRPTMAEEATQINLRLTPKLLAHVDAMRGNYGMSRPGYMKQLIIDDIRRQGPNGRTALAPRTTTAHRLAMHRLTMADETTQINLRLPPRLLRHVDAQRQHYGMTRPDYLRDLIIGDIRRQGPNGRTSLAPRIAPEPTPAA